MPLSNNTVEIDLAALRHNFRALLNRVGPGVKILAMVKSEGYGHGLVATARALQDAGAAYFGVAEVDEGISLRQAGLAGQIIVLLGSDCVDEVIKYNLSPVVFDLKNLQRLSAAAVQKKKEVSVHLKIDVGMGRIGISPAQTNLYIDRIKMLPGLCLGGIMGHFPCADDLAAKEMTLSQYQHFSDLLQKGGECNNCEDRNRAGGPLLHIANSAAIINCPSTFLHLVRPGIALYGYHPAGRAEDDSLDLNPVMSFKSRVIQVKEVPAGSGISYGHLYVTKRPSTMAVLPVGYADGFLRSMTGRAEVLIHGKRAKICGRICMNACLADVTDIAGVQSGDEVVLLGSQQCQGSSAESSAIYADEIAAWMETISYEVLCLFGNNNDRVYLNENL